ncbi:ABC transporter ATP-binding protein [Clostridium septicum]|uniref:ABC transporter ATP-binding protein n=1 Tax=Clostridium septicum TaxID=1504 RepID=UPI0008341180|nr:ABC transporter ATP-binding protein [Clostridium septicum]
MELIKLKGLNKKYGENFYALKDVNLDIMEKDFVSIMGPSGSGKSTLLNIIGCMDSVTSGEYYLDGKLVNKLNGNKLSLIRNKDISFVFQHFAIMKDYNVYDNVELPLLRRKLSKKERKSKIKEILKRLDIEDQIKKMPNELSGGQQQRVAIARALVSEAKIILADEPTGALDKKTGEDIMNLLKELNDEGKTIVLITHDEKVDSYAKRHIKIEDGKLYEVV